MNLKLFKRTRHWLRRSNVSLMAVMLVSGTGNALAISHYQGEARDLSSGNLLYREVHCIFPLSNETSEGHAALTTLPAETVRYLSADESTVATKQLRHGLRLLPGDSATPASATQSTAPDGINTAWVPEYEFIHHDTEFIEGLRYRDNQVVLYRRESNRASWEEKAIDFRRVKKPVIADAGFDVFIRDHLDDFKSGESLDVIYLSAPRLTTLDFTLQPQEQTDERIVLSMFPTNFVIRLLVDPLRVTYSSNTGRLLNFQGLTNVPKNIEKNYIASIDYLYGEDLDAFCQ